jgi:hypothetical protein
MRYRLWFASLVGCLFLVSISDAAAVQYKISIDTVPQDLVQPLSKSITIPDSVANKGLFDRITDYLYQEDPLKIDGLSEKFEPYVAAGLLFLAFAVSLFFMSFLLLQLFFFLEVVFLLMLLTSAVFFVVGAVFARKGLKRIKKNGKKGRNWARLIIVASICPPLIPLFIVLLLSIFFSDIALDFFSGF